MKNTILNECDDYEIVKRAYLNSVRNASIQTLEDIESGNLDGSEFMEYQHKLFQKLQEFEKENPTLTKRSPRSATNHPI